MLLDIDGVLTIADDVFIFGIDENSHDLALAKVLERCGEKGVTLNLKKCVFSKENLKFFGYIFSKDGMKPNFDKVEEIKNTSTPENVKAPGSFLGLTNYMKRFIDYYYYHFISIR